jgi:hypothetical protein
MIQASNASRSRSGTLHNQQNRERRKEKKDSVSHWITVFCIPPIFPIQIITQTDTSSEVPAKSKQSYQDKTQNSTQAKSIHVIPFPTSRQSPNLMTFHRSPCKKRTQEHPIRVSSSTCTSYLSFPNFLYNSKRTERKPSVTHRPIKHP